MYIFEDGTSKISLWIIANRWTYSLDGVDGRALSLKGNILPLPESFIIDLLPEMIKRVVCNKNFPREM